MNELKHKILSAMARKGLTQYALAMAMGVNQATISGWLSGVKPRPAKLKQLTDYLDSLETEELKSHAKALDMIPLSVAIPIEFRKQLERAAKLEGKTLSRYVRNALERVDEIQSLENEKKENIELKSTLAAKEKEIERLHETLRAFISGGFPLPAVTVATAQTLPKTRTNISRDPLRPMIQEGRARIQKSSID
jgi:transcriptional regulator with XRE-family HTH domain